MKRLLTLVIGLLLLAALIYYFVTMRAPAIEADMRACVAAGLGEIDAGGIEVAVDGRDVSLSGTVPSDVLMRQAEIVAAEDCGARMVTNSLQVIELPPYETQLCIDANVVRMSGNVEDAAGRDAALAFAREYYPTDLDADLVLRADAPEGHGDLLAAALLDLAQLDSGCISLTDATLSVGGSIRSQAARERLVETLGAAAGTRFETYYDVSVPQKSERAQKCEAFFAQLLEPDESVLFDADGSEIHADGQRLLDSVVARMARCTGLHVTVVGHTDSIGDVAYNRDLSLRHAQAVADYLVAKGIDPADLTAVGFGEAQPRASNASSEGRVRNRRIEFRVRESG